MRISKRNWIGSCIMIVGWLIGDLSTALTALYVGMIYFSMGMIFIVWEYVPDVEEFEGAGNVIAPLFDGIESEDDAKVRAIGVLMIFFAGVGCLFSPFIEDWGLWAVGLPGAYLIIHSYQEWIEEYLIPIPRR